MSDVVGLYRRFGVKLKPVGDGWVTCRCFTGQHQDRHPSARVHLRSGGFRCFTCGARGGCLDALEHLGATRDQARQLAIDYGVIDPPKRQTRPPPTPPIPPPTPPPPPQNTAQHHAAKPKTDYAAAPLKHSPQIDWDQVTNTQVVHDRTWTYTDQNNVPVGRIRRLDMSDGHKRIWQERPHQNGWATGLDGAHLPLYQLPQVLKHAQAGKRIVIVEGEKAVDALQRLSIFATTNAGGAGKWRPQHTRTLNGATVTVICDSDQPGRQHAWQISNELADAAVAVRTPLDVAPLRNDGYDIVDYLTAIAETSRQTTPTQQNDELRNKLRQHLRKLLDAQLPATTQTLQRWHEHAQYLTSRDGRAYLHCPRCQERRVHRLTHGIAFCPCGTHQTAPAPDAAV